MLQKWIIEGKVQRDDARLGPLYDRALPIGQRSRIFLTTR
jgi:hypothetical protein